MKKNNIIMVSITAAVTCAITAISVYGAVTPTPTEYIGDARAVEIAQTDVKAIESGEQTVVKNRFEIDDGIAEYDIEITVGTTKYEYEINALTGAVRSREIEQAKMKVKTDTQRQTPAKSSNTTAAAVDSQYIAESKAIEIAQADVKTLDTSVQTVVKTKFDYDDGIAEYEVCIVIGTTKYDYEIDALTGVINSREIEVKGSKGIANLADPSLYIGEDKAKSIILEFAKIPASAATFVKCKIDREDGTYVYEIEFYANGNEYEAEINAITGEIVDFEMDD